MQLDLKNQLARRRFKLLPGGLSLKKIMAGWGFIESKSSCQATAMRMVIDLAEDNYMYAVLPAQQNFIKKASWPS